MSTRAQVYFKETGVYHYQHSDGMDLFKIVKKSLARAKKVGRLDDSCYLARIVFCDMIKVAEESAYSKDQYGYNGSLGYGIDTERHGDIQYLITIDATGKATQERIWLIRRL